MPGVRAVLGRSPLQVAIEHINATKERDRRDAARRRVDLLHDKSEQVLREEFMRIFARERVARLNPFAKLSGALALYKRTVREIVQPAYSPPPLRTIVAGGDDAGAPGKRPTKPGPAQEAWNALATRLRYDAKMALAALFVQGTNAAILHGRVNKRLGPVMDVIAPNCVTVIPDPDDPTRELAVIYDRKVLVAGREEVEYTYWDEDEAFRFTAGGRIVPLSDGLGVVTKKSGHPGFLPFVVIHRTERSGCYWDETSGDDLVAANNSVGVLVAMMLRLLKTQGHRQLGVTETIAGGGAVRDMAEDQLLDAEATVVGTQGKDIRVLFDPTPVDHFLKPIDVVSTGAAANHGLSRDRMNLQGPALAETAGLLERRAELIVRCDDGEVRAFEMWKRLSKALPANEQIPDDARMVADFAEISTKVERLKQLEIWEKELSKGLRSIYDCIREDNPEVLTDEAAQAEIQRNAESYAWFVELFRKLNIRTDGGTDQPGQSAQENGAMGQKVRDGQMTKDEAAQKARGDKPANGADEG